MQRNTWILLVSIIALSFSNLRAQDNLTPGAAIDLKQCVDIALKNNLLVTQSSLQVQSSTVNATQAWEYMLPNINASANYGVNFGRSLNQNTYTYSDEQFNSSNYGINAGLLLFSGLQVQNQIRQSKFALEASKMDLQQQKDVITLNVLLAYLQVLSNQDLLQISRAQADVDLKQVERLEIMRKDGAIPILSTYYDLKGQYANDLVNIANNVNALESSKISLFQILNIPYRKDLVYDRIPLDLNAPAYGPSSDSIYQTALAVLPQIKSVDLKIKASERALGVARSAYYPTLSAYAGIGSNYSSVAQSQTPTFISTDTSQNAYVYVPNNNYPVITKNQNYSFSNISFGDQYKNNRYEQVGLQINIPILNYMRARNNVKLAKINLKNAQYIAQASRNQLQQMVEQAYQNMLNAYEQYKSYRDQVAAYNESFRGAEIRFNDGAITSVDYVIAKNNIDRANLSLTQARYNFIFRTKILDYYQGKLTW
ncbi:MAG: TolC family protein [Chitinophagales bacterium]